MVFDCFSNGAYEPQKFVENRYQNIVVLLVFII